MSYNGRIAAYIFDKGRHTMPCVLSRLPRSSSAKYGWHVSIISKTYKHLPEDLFYFVLRPGQDAPAVLIGKLPPCAHLLRVIS